MAVITKTNFRVGPSAAVDARTMKITVRDTTELQEKIDLSRYVGMERVNPTRLVVVDQFPKSGEQVPSGTPVVLTFMSKDSIPVVDIADLSETIKGKYSGADVKNDTDDCSLRCGNEKSC